MVTEARVGAGHSLVIGAIVRSQRGVDSGARSP